MALTETEDEKPVGDTKVIWPEGNVASIHAVKIIELPFLGPPEAA
jgi:hypothetical protein